MLTFLATQLELDTNAYELAARSWPVLVQRLPNVAGFVRGMAAALDGDVIRATALLLHEELVHLEHCSALGVRRTNDHGPLLGQNWDWPATSYNFPCVVRQLGGEGPDTVTYAYPGLWACAGVNADGLSVLWSGAGYWPSVPPQPGIPTYALLAGLLELSTVEEAVGLLSEGIHAGCFMFFLADRDGDLAAVEGWPGGCCVDRGNTLLRTNHYLCKEAIAATGQRDPYSVSESTTAARLDRLCELVGARGPVSDREIAGAILRSPGIGSAGTKDSPLGWPRHPGEAASSYVSMTIDTLLVEPREPVLWIARGNPGGQSLSSPFLPYNL